MPEVPHVETLILGAGVCGLVAARLLADAGRTVRLWDKGRVPGGRACTRALASGAAVDHGCRPFAANDAVAQTVLAGWLAAGALGPVPGGRTPLFAGGPTMGDLGRSLAAGLDIAVRTTAVRLTHESGGWRVASAEGAEVVAARVLVTFPVPQSLALLDASGVRLPDAFVGLRDVHYDPCLTLLVPLSAPANLPSGGTYDPAPGVAWLGDNRRTGTPPAAVVQATGTWSRARASADDGTIASELLAAARHLLPAPSGDAVVKRWRYAFPTTTFSEPFAEVAPGLFLAGDGLGGPDVAGAIRSGVAVGEALAGGSR